MDGATLRERVGAAAGRDVAGQAGIGVIGDQINLRLELIGC